MGFFDKLGMGGGKITVDVPSTPVAAGSSVRGTLTFTGGKRPQKITALLVWLTRGEGTEINLGKLEATKSGGSSAPIGAKVTVASEMSAQPNEVYAFPFELQIPERIMNSRSMDINGQPGPIMQLYRVWGSADIPGEMDKHGESANFEVTGGLKVEVTTT